MSLKDQAKTFITSVISNHLAANIRTYKWKTYTGERNTNSLGGVSFLSAESATVVDTDGTFTLFKVKPSEFVIVKTDLLSEPVQIGAKVALSFYKLKRFDGTSADGSDDPTVAGIRTIMLTGAKTIFPVKWEGRYLGINERFADQYREIGNAYLRDLLTQMESQYVDDGMRAPINVLIDANATQLDFIDPGVDCGSLVAPGLRVRVASSKFQGDVTIEYDRGADTYRVILEPQDSLERIVVDDVHFNELGNVLVESIDDGEWRKAKVTVLKAAPKKKAPAPTA